MAWLSGYSTISSFTSAHPEAVVVVSDTNNDIIAAVYDIGNLVC